MKDLKKVSSAGKEREIYHGTAESYANSILKDGLLVSKGQKGMASGVYGSLKKVDAFYHAGLAAENVARRMIQQEGKPQKEVLENLKVMLITCDREKFPTKVYEKASFYRSKVDVKPNAFQKVEVFKYSDVNKYIKKTRVDMWMGKDTSHVPFPKAIEVRREALQQKGPLFLAFAVMVDEKGKSKSKGKD